MAAVVPLPRIEAQVELRYLGNGKAGRLPIGVRRMLRMYFLQQGATLDDETLVDALYHAPMAHPRGE